MEENGGIPARWLTGGGPEVGEKLQGVKAVHKSCLAGARTAGRVVPTATQDGGEREIDGEVDAGLKGGDGRAGELHGNQAKLLEVLVLIKRRRGELSTAARSGGNGARQRRQCSVQEKEEESEWAGERGPQRS
jgi:hypothetical protein